MEEVVQSDSFADQVYSIIRRQIVTMTLKPGEKLGIEQLASTLGVSRTPVREALNILAREGLVTVKPRVGYYVVQLTRSDVEELCDIRKMIELYSLEQAVITIPVSVWQDHLANNRSFLEAQGRKLPGSFFSIDKNLHATILAGLNNNRLSELTDQVWAFVDLMFNMNRRITEATREHIAILEAILNQDLPGAKNRLANHIDNVCEAIIRNM